MKLTITQTKSGTYTTLVSAGFYHDNGIRKRNQKRITADSREEVELKAIAYREKYLNNQLPAPSKMTLNSYINKWLQSKEGKIVEGTLTRYRREIRIRIIPYLGAKKIQKIDNEMIQTFIDKVTLDFDLSRKTSELTLSILKGIFDSAIKDKIIRENPVYKIDLRLKKRSKRIVWEKPHIEIFLSHCNDRKRGKYYLAVFAALATGARKGEILGLTWDKIDFEKNIITISQILESDGSKLSERTKGGVDDIRIIKMPRLLKDELLLHKERQLKTVKENPHNLVFCTSRGKRVIPNTLNDVLNKYCELFELPRIRFHDLRHSFATLLMDLNIPTSTISKILGHSDVGVTERIYIHGTETMEEIAVDKVNEIFAV